MEEERIICPYTETCEFYKVYAQYENKPRKDIIEVIYDYPYYHACKALGNVLLEHASEVGIKEDADVDCALIKLLDNALLQKTLFDEKSKDS